MSKIKLAVIHMANIQTTEALLMSQFGSAYALNTANCTKNPKWLPNYDWKTLGNSLCVIAADLCDEFENEFSCFVFDETANKSFWILNGQYDSVPAIFFQVDLETHSTKFKTLIDLARHFLNNSIISAAADDLFSSFYWKIEHPKIDNVILDVESYAWATKTYEFIVEIRNKDNKSLKKTAKKLLGKQWT